MGTDAGDFDAGVAMFDGNPFGEGEGGVFGDGVGGGADLGEESGGGDDLEEVAVAAGEHVGEDGAGGVEMGAEVDGEDALPVYIGGIEASGDEDAGVGTEEVDVAVGGEGAVDQLLDGGFGGDVGRDGESAG